MPNHKRDEHLNTIKENIDKTDQLSESEKSESMKRIEEWVLEDKAFGILEMELIKINEFFEEIFSELGLK
ncbi:MAG: hypothetical protein U9N33_04440 [Campylobacterota bacterium]|nr:hypothetical protein [Campylobacterota bacterium]